ncbi:MAG: hypothetical protein KDD84_07935, partial [Caldilineaceae bacterium]|nr:hypothetical protein [Caldilineaceae bacterium]
HVPALLNSVFFDAGTQRAGAPMLLFASEDQFRGVALGTAGYSTVNGSQVSIDFAPAGQDVQAVNTIAGLSWAPYRYNSDAQSWESYPFTEYWDLLEIRLRDNQVFGAETNEDDQIFGEGMRMLAKTYFAYLYQGRANLVQINNTPLGLLDTNAESYLSRFERAEQTIAGQDVVNAIGSATLINVVVQPFALHLIDNFRQWRYQRVLVRTPEGAQTIQNVIGAGVDVDNTTFKKLMKNIFLGIRKDLSQEYVRSLKFSNRKLTFGVAGVATTVLLAGVGAGVYLGVQGQSAGTAQQVLTAVGTSLSVLSLVTLTNAARNAAQGVAGLANTVRAINQQLATTSRAAQVVGAIGLLIAQVINYGGLIALIVSNGLDWFGLEANRLAATSIAATITGVLLFALATTGIGAIVVAIIGLIDGLIFLICGYLSKEQVESTAGIALCRGITGWITELIAYGIYAQNEITQIYDPYRLNYLGFSPSLQDPAAGFVPDAPLSMALTLRNTLALASIPPNLGATYWHQFSEDRLRSARFTYAILAEKPAEDAAQLHDSLVRGQGSDPWNVLERDAEGNLVRVYDDTQVTSSALRLPATPGLNRRISAYLAEGYQVPVQECTSTAALTPWLPVPICWLRSRGETTYSDLNLTYDVFPATVDAFWSLSAVGDQPGRYRQDWADSAAVDFPPLIDADGDGLTYEDDTDDTRWDIDGDGLSDRIEQTRRTRVDDRDSDGDNLTDVQEALWETDPNLPDSDGDGLRDGDEILGWNIAYGANSQGQALLSWARSDPLSRDADLDQLLDSQEKLYGFNPNVDDADKAMLYDSTLVETQAPLLLTRFEERSGAISFRDAVSADASAAGCTVDTCPVAGIQGRFGNAAFFNGVDQFVEMPPKRSIGQLSGSYTLSAWVKPTKLSGVQTVIQIGPGGPNSVGSVAFGLSDGNLFLRVEGVGTDVQAPPGGTTLTLNQWNHIMVESYFNTLYFSVNGQYVNGGTLAKQTSDNPRITIGAAQQPESGVAPTGDDQGSVPLTQIDHFAGAIDEVVILNWTAPDTRNIEAFFAGRYNLNDGILRPDQEVSYTSS